MLPTQIDVLIVGAGPAGSSAAIELARAGYTVVLADRESFPRDKVCGDALIPDSLSALKRLSLEARVAQVACQLRELSVFAPNGTEVRLRGTFAAVPRQVFDHLLVEAAQECGAFVLTPYKSVAPILTDDRVTGASFVHSQTGDSMAVKARFTLLATGADGTSLRQFGIADSAEPTALAARAYFKIPDDLSQSFERLMISYDKSICPGYGWIFPGPHRTLNVGVGIFRDAGNPPLNLRRIWDTFLATFPPARLLATRGTQLGDLKGAPLRTAMRGSRLWRPGLLTLGEAAGLTFSFSGEGIGKAMESGILAAELVQSPLRHNNAAEPGLVYEQTLNERYRELFDGYFTVQKWLAWPSVCNIVAWRANRSPYVMSQLEGMLSESVEPAALFSLRGFFRSLVG